MIERRATPNPYDIAGALAILYTLAYMGMVTLLFFITVPTGNQQIVNTLIGIMSMIQGAIIQFFFGSSKAAETTQRAVIQQQARAVEVIAAATNGKVKTGEVNVDATGGDVNITKGEAK